MRQPKSSLKDRPRPSSASIATPTLAIPIRLRRGPLAPWFRFGILDDRAPNPIAPITDKRALRDFCLHLQVEGQSWIWCEALGGSLNVKPGDALFLPPGFVHAWAYVGETHLAVHFDLQRNPRLTSHNYEGSFDMIRHIEGHAEEKPCTTMPVFHLLLPGQDISEAWRIPLVTHLPNPEEWKRRLGDLVRRWETRTVGTVLSQLRANRTLGWAMEELTVQAEHNLHLADDPRIAELINRLRDPAVLAEVARQPVADLAHRLNLGETLFRKRFRIMTSRTPHQYFRELQVYHASDLLGQTSLRIKEIAQRLGFDDPYHFSRVFRAITGRSPAQYRRERGGSLARPRPTPSPSSSLSGFAPVEGLPAETAGSKI